MAQDWIPYCKSLPTKIEVVRIAQRTGRSRREVVAILMEFWSWADAETDDGILHGVSVRDLSALIAETDGSFWGTLAEVGWIKEINSEVVIPNFAFWMGRSAKKRLKDTRRKQGNPRNPTTFPLKIRDVSASETDKSVTTEQNSINTPVVPIEEKPAKKQTAGFEIFWKAYPKKVDVETARRAWRKLQPDDALLQEMLTAIEQQKKSRKWLDGFVKNPATWLNAGSWKDQVEQPTGGLFTAQAGLDQEAERQRKFREREELLAKERSQDGESS